MGTTSSNVVSSGKAASPALHNTHVTDKHSSGDRTSLTLPSKHSRHTSTHHSLHDTQESNVTQRAFKTLFGYGPWSRHQGGNQSHHAPWVRMGRWGDEERGQSVVRLDNGRNDERGNVTPGGEGSGVRRPWSSCTYPTWTWRHNRTRWWCLDLISSLDIRLL